MYNLTTYFDVRKQLTKDIKHYHDEIKFYLRIDDTLTAKKIEGRITRAIDRFNKMFDCDYLEGERFYK